MKISEVYAKIESLIKKGVINHHQGDNSIYLKHLLLRSRKEDKIYHKTETLIRGVCSSNNISVQQRDMYLSSANLGRG